MDTQVLLRKLDKIMVNSLLYSITTNDMTGHSIGLGSELTIEGVDVVYKCCGVSRDDQNNYRIFACDKTGENIHVCQIIDKGRITGENHVTEDVFTKLASEYWDGENLAKVFELNQVLNILSEM